MLATCFRFSVGLRENGLGYEVIGGVLWVTVVVLVAVSLTLVERLVSIKQMCIGDLFFTFGWLSRGQIGI